jgi:hypothetical protein
MHPVLDEAELDCGQGDDDRHQDDRLRRLTAEVEPDDAVIPDLVDEDFGGFGPPCVMLGYRRRCRSLKDAR